MAVFSRRNGYNNDAIQIECVSEALKKRIIAAFYKEEFDVYDTLDYKNYTTGIEDMMIEMGITYEFPNTKIDKQNNAQELQKYIINSDKWYIIFDFIERYLGITSDKEKVKKMTKIFNHILEDEASAYRILDGKIVPIVNESELLTIEEAKNSSYDSVRIHISKAIDLFADRKKPDYENSIKESISAVEAMCCIITGLNGKDATLGNALNKLEKSGIHIHKAMKSGFSSLYGYTSDESGIRHGGIDFTNAPAEDAKYMLISCSAFTNYLIEKWRKVKDA